MDTSFAELSFAASHALGQPFSMRALEQILDALLQAYRGESPIRGEDLFQSLRLDDKTRREVDLRRFRMQAVKATRETVYYAELFSRLGLDPGRLTWEDIARIPLTPKEAIRDHPDDFVCRSAEPVFRATTTGTTGRPTRVSFSRAELQLSMLLGAINNLLIQDIIPDDVYLLLGGSRATLSDVTAVGILALIGALTIFAGQGDPERTLGLLMEESHLPRKRSRVSQLLIYPSYLDELITRGQRLGHKPSDFGLRHIDISGEVVTEGVKRRAEQLFGPVAIYEGYGMTETWGMGAGSCPEGHIHFGTAGGLWEFVNPDTGAPAGPGEVASIVPTPLPPFRETTLLLRYDTQDLVWLPQSPFECRAGRLPASTPLLGKRGLSVRHDGGWTYPRDVIEAFEEVECMPYPARFGFWAVEGGVAVEVVVRGDQLVARKAIGETLEAHGVPLRELNLRDDRSQLQQPYPLRGDL